jgi:hypothetical protein
MADVLKSPLENSQEEEQSVTPQRLPDIEMTASEPVDNTVDTRGTSLGVWSEPDIDEGMTTWESMKLGADNWIMPSSQVYRDMDQFPSQGAFWTPELVEKSTEGLTGSFAEFVLEADSEAEASYRRELSLKKQDAYQRMAKGGVGNIIASALVEAVDPAELTAVTLFTLGSGTLFNAGANLLRAGKKVDDTLALANSIKQAKNATSIGKQFLGGAAATTAAVTPFELYRQGAQPAYGDDDLMNVLMFAGTLGGTFKGTGAYFQMAKLDRQFRARTAAGNPPLSDKEKKFYEQLIGSSRIDTANARIKASDLAAGSDRQLEDIEEALMQNMVSFEAGAISRKVLDDDVALANKDIGGDVFSVKLDKDGNAVGINVDKEKLPDSWKDEAGLNLSPLTTSEAAAGKFDNSSKQIRAPRLLTFFLDRRLSSVARTMNSESGAVREAGSRLGLNSSGNVDRSATKMDAISQQNFFHQTSTARVVNTFKSAAKAWRSMNKSSTLNPLQRMEEDIEYYIEVGRAVRRGGSDDPHIQAGVDAWIKEQKFFLEESQKAYVKGADQLSFTADYMPRLIEDGKWDDFIKRYGDEEIISMYEGAIKAKQKDIDPDLARKIAEGYVQGVTKRLHDRITGQVPAMRMGFLNDEIEDIKAGLQSSGKYTDEELNDILAQVEQAYSRDVGESGTVARMKSRIDMDETYIHTMANGKTISVEDVLNNNIMEIHQQYAFQMGGAIGLARNGMNRQGEESFDNFIKNLRDEAVNLGDRKAVDQRLDEIDALEFMYDGITGRLAHQAGMSEGTEVALRRVREFNFIRTMGASGIPTMVESASVLFEHTAATLFKALPRLRHMIKKTQKGELDDPLMRELMHFTGVGIDMMTGRVRTYFDDVETDLVKSNYGKLDMGLAAGRNFVATASGMLPLTAMFRRADSMFFAYDWFAAAKKGKSPYAAIKMEQLGLEAADADLINKMINKHASTGKGGNLNTLNLDKWLEDGADGERAHRLFSLAAYRHATQSVQESNLGSTNRFLRSPWGKTIGQFLSYVLSAQEQQFQRHSARIMKGDVMASSRILLAGSFVSTLAYISGVHYRSIGMSDKRRKKYLEDRLTPTKMFTDGAIGYLGFFSFQSTIFQRTREANLINNPTFDLIRLAADGAEILGGAAFGEGKISEAQASRMLGIGMPNWYPLGMARNAIADKITQD